MLWFLVLVVSSSPLVAQDIINQGKLALNSHDTAAAIQSFTNAIKMGQKEGEASFYLGAIAAARHQLDDAQRYLETATRIDEDNADAIGLLAGVYAAKRNYPLSLATYRKALKRAPKSSAVATGFGLTLLAADSVGASIVELTRARELDETNPAIYEALGAAYARQGVAPLAVMNYKRAIEIAPKETEYRFELAQLLEKNRQYVDAIAQYDSVMVIDTTNVEVCLRIGKILARATGDVKKKAIPPLKRYVDKRPTSVEGAEVLARVLFLTEYYDEAVKAARHALDLNPTNIETMREYANSLEEIKNHAEALKEFEQIIKLNGLKPEDLVNYANALMGVGREKEAKEVLLKAYHDDSTNCDVFFNLGFLYMKDQDWANAAQMFEKKIKCEPRSLSSYLNAAASYMAMKNWERTRQLLDSALAMSPNFQQARLMFARYFLQVDSLERAVQQYDFVLDEVAKNPDAKGNKQIAGEAHFMKGSAYFIKQRYAAAIEEFRKAQALGYDNGGMELSWGQAILQTLDKNASDEENQKKKEDALAHFRRSVQMPPDVAASHFWLGQTLILLREPGSPINPKLEEEACSEFKKALRLKPGDGDTKKAMERIGCK
jgi:tetratricopeptide (TPR) repeat protein